ncbi:MAG: cytochrome bc complex cytochrome b subunit [Acidiferrobacterales bacterium]
MQTLLAWIDERFPLTKVWEEHLAKYYAPKNFNFWYYFGSLAMLALGVQIVTGIFLAIHYKPDAERAFASVEYIMRDVPWGWLMRYMHSTVASMFFVVVYLHIFRALLYGSHRKPRELIWIIGVVILITLMATSFTGYLLPWGNMSYWGAQVIISLFGAIPLIGENLAELIRGDFVVSDATLNRFFVFHIVLFPLVLIGLVYIHIVALHKVGSNNPDGIEIKKNKNKSGVPVDGIPFHPYYTVKDMVGVTVFLMVCSAIIFFAPELGGWFLEHDNFEPANILQTPPEIVPLWYLTPFYSILRAVTIDIGPISAKLLGVLSMGFSLILFFFLPWLDRSPVKSIRYRGWIYRVALMLFVVSFVVLGYLGTQRPEGPNLVIAQICYFLYFAFFLLMPWYTKIDKTKPVPDRVRAR